MEEKTKKNNYSSTRNIILRMCIVGIFSALCFVCTSFLQIPYAGGHGYFNFGDCISLLVSLLIGPIDGMLVGMLGGSLSDLFLGSAYFVPWTLLAKGLMCLVSGILFKVLNKKKIIRFISPFIGSLLMVLVYLVCYIYLYGYGSMLSSCFDLVQAIVASIISILIYVPLEKTKIKQRMNL